MGKAAARRRIPEPGWRLVGGIDLGHGIICGIAGAGDGGGVAAVGGTHASEDAG
jgi:hypothetical protein